MIVAGVGFRQGVAAEEIGALVFRALDTMSLAPRLLSRLATAGTRAHEPGLIEAARQLGVPVTAIGPDALAVAAPDVRTQSERVRALYGVGSVAEAAALACAGDGAELLLGRIASARATCALARGRRP